MFEREVDPGMLAYVRRMSDEAWRECCEKLKTPEGESDGVEE